LTQIFGKGTAMQTEPEQTEREQAPIAPGRWPAEFFTKYVEGESGAARRVMNRAVRGEIFGGPEFFDALGVLDSIGRSLTAAGDEKNVARVEQALDQLDVVRQGLYRVICERYGLPFDLAQRAGERRG
jgi:hypothetical protein